MCFFVLYPAYCSFFYISIKSDSPTHIAAEMSSCKPYVPSNQAPITNGLNKLLITNVSKHKSLIPNLLNNLALITIVPFSQREITDYCAYLQ